MKRLLLLLSLAAFSSCATIFNSPHSTTSLTTNAPRTAIIGPDTIALKPRTAAIPIVLPRNKQPQEIVIYSDSRTDTVVLRSYWSDAYYFNIASYGIGFLIDRNTPKKWRYDKAIHFTDRWIAQNRLHNPLRYPAGTVNLRYGLPYVNLFNLTDATTGRQKSNAGFMGFSLGVDYFYSDEAFLTLSGTSIMNFFLPFPAAARFTGIWEHRYSFYGSLSNNHLLFNDRLSVGYGLHFGADTWNTKDHGPLPEEADSYIYQPNIHRKSTSLGPIFPLYYLTRRSFYMGVVYRPMLLQFAHHKTDFRYQHTISFELGWRIRLSAL